MRKKRTIRSANQDHTGWWIYREVEQWVSKRQKALTANSRCLIYLNLRLIRAKSREEAYRKALAWGRVGDRSKSNGGEWRFAGIAMLLPVYEKFEDGSEILWEDRKLMTVAKIKKLVKTRRQLPVFDDTEEA